jgi:phage terminase large subunit
LYQLRVAFMIAPSTTNDWPIDYVEVYAWRQQQLKEIRRNPKLLAGAKAFYASHPVEFINHWANTYDPRNAGTEVPAKLPLVLFERQAELVRFLVACLASEEGGLIEKARDMGATWVCCAFTVWLWIFWPGASIGWGSRKEALVDRIGDPDSIFEKIRNLIEGIPKEFWPDGFIPDHMAFTKIISRKTGSSITGEAGDKIGRGGRKLMYFKDESAHYERPERIEASLSENTRVPIDISSVNGLGNVFHRRREAGADWTGKVVPGRTQVFVMDWRDHPAKNDEWYNIRKRKFEDDGLAHIFAQEVDRNYSASVEGIIIPAEWVRASIDAHLTLDGFSETGPWGSALDVADGGGDTNAQAGRQGPILRFVTEWGARDVAVTARNAAANLEDLGPVALQYDCIGIGSSVKAEANNLIDAGAMPKGMTFVPWSAAAAVQNPHNRVVKKEDGTDDMESPKNKDFYQNLKAQAWWELRNRFYRTFKAVTEDAEYNADDLISIDSTIPALRKLEKELSQATMKRGATLKLVVDKSPEGTRSPNMADAVVMAYWPIQQANVTATFGTYGNSN